MNFLRQLSAVMVLLTASAVSQADVKFQFLKDFGFGGTASGINSKGAIVGNAVVNDEFRLEPVIWSSREDPPVTLPSGGEGGGAVAISDNGMIVGWVYSGGVSTPAAWLDGVLVSLPTLGNGGYTSDVNDAGHIVGSVYYGASLRPALWKDGELTILPLPPSDSQAETFTATANRINVSGEIIGTVRYGSDSVALRWTRGEVSPILVNSWQETRGTGIDDAGDVLINGYLDGSGSAFSLGTISSDLSSAILVSPASALGVYGTDFSPNGIAVGYSLFSADGISTLRGSGWREGSIQHLELPDGSRWAFPHGVGSDGTIVGSISDGISGESWAGFWQLSQDIVDIESLSGVPTQEVALSASVKRAGSGVSGRGVQFMIAGRKVGTATTDKAGKASLKYKIPPTAKLGSHSFSAVASSGAEDSATLTIDRRATRLAVSAINAVPGQTVRITGLLSDAKTRRGIPNETVSFQHGGRNYSGKTNANGTYSVPFTVPKSQKPKTQIPLTIAYPGSPSTKASSAKGSISVR